MEPISFAVSLLPIIFSLRTVMKKIRRYQRQFKRAEKELRVLRRDVSNFSNLLIHADDALDELEGLISLTQGECEGLIKVRNSAERLAKSLLAFLKRQARLFTEKQGWVPSLIKNARASRQWSAAQTELALFKWRLLSSKGSLDLLLSIVRIRTLKALLEKAHAQETAISGKKERLEKKIQLAQMAITSKVSEMKTLEVEYEELHRELDQGNPMQGTERKNLQEAFSVIEAVKEVVRDETQFMQSNASRLASSHSERDQQYKVPGMDGYLQGDKSSRLPIAEISTTPSTTESSQYTENATTNEMDNSSDSHSTSSSSGLVIRCHKPREKKPSTPIKKDPVTRSSIGSTKQKIAPRSYPTMRKELNSSTEDTSRDNTDIRASALSDEHLHFDPGFNLGTLSAAIHTKRNQGHPVPEPNSKYRFEETRNSLSDKPDYREQGHV